MTLEEAVMKYRDTLYDLETSEETSEKMFREQSILCMYLDTFKICNNKQKEGLCLDQDLELFDILINMESSDDILAEVSADPSFLYRLILNCYNFSSMNDLGKISLVKSLSTTENDWLSSLIPSHQIDLDTYDKEIDIDVLIDSVKKHLKYQDKYLDMKCDDAMILMLTGFIRNLLKTHHESGLSLILEIAKIDYAASKYLNSFVEDDEVLIDKIDFYENYLLDDILYRLSNSEEFLRSAIWMFYSVYIDEIYGEIKITKENLDSAEAKEMNKKLILE